MATITVSPRYQEWCLALTFEANRVADEHRHQGDLVRMAVANGLTWEEVGSMHFITKQTAWTRWHASETEE
jgi:hypothetical protein